MHGNQALVASGDDGDDGDAVLPFYGKVSLTEKTQWEGKQSSSSSLSSPVQAVCSDEPTPLRWIDASAYHQRTDTGYQVSAAKSPAGWLYTAWASDRAPGVHYHDVPDALGAREHYNRGEHVPQRFPCLGHFRTATAARAACQAHAATADPRGSFHHPPPLRYPKGAGFG